jgi:hypothetical protein
VTLDTDLLIEAVDAIMLETDQVAYRFHNGKTDDDKSWDISRESFWTHLVLMNHRNKKSLISR